MIISGYQLKHGVFIPEGSNREVEFNNLYLSCLHSDLPSSENCFSSGQICEVVKIKNDPEVLSKVFQGLVNVLPNDLDVLIGSNIEVYYDKNGNIKLVDFVDEPVSDGQSA